MSKLDDVRARLERAGERAREVSRQARLSTASRHFEFRAHAARYARRELTRPQVSPRAGRCSYCLAEYRPRVCNACLRSGATQAAIPAQHLKLAQASTCYFCLAETEVFSMAIDHRLRRMCCGACEELGARLPPAAVSYVAGGLPTVEGLILGAYMALALTGEA